MSTGKKAERSSPKGKNRGRTETAIRKSAVETPFQRFNRKLKARFHKSLDLHVVWVVVYLVPLVWILSPKPTGLPEVQIGAVASKDFVAPREALVLAEGTTTEARQKARDEVLPVYDLDTSASERFTEGVESIFAEGRRRLEAWQVLKTESALPEGSGPLDGFAEEAALRLSPEAMQVLETKEFPVELEDLLKATVKDLLYNGLIANKSDLLENRSRGILLRDLQSGAEKKTVDLFGCEEYPAGARAQLEAEMRRWPSLRRSQRTAMVEMVVENVSTNLQLNPSETLIRRDAAAEAVEPVYTRVVEGQVIVRQGDRINESAARIIQSLGEEKGWNSLLLPVMGTFLFLLLVALGLWFGLKNVGFSGPRDRSAFSELLILIMLSLVGVELGRTISNALAQFFATDILGNAGDWMFAIPYASLALVVILVYGRGAAFLASLAFSLVADRLIGDASVGIFFYSMAGSLAAVFFIDHLQFKSRSFMLRAGAIVALVNVLVVLMGAALNGGGGAALVFQLLLAVGSGILVTAVTSFAIPLVEVSYSATTAIKLIELANTNLPLLRRLALDAPGSFQHSLMVANLAKTGCEAIEANSVLAYTASLYHDIGKMFRPEYFIENQRPGFNRHDKLLPSMSALILISHVKDGTELAKAHQLPKPIIDAIEQHHGTRLIRYFHNRAVEMQDPEAGEVSEDKFRYPGPRPQSKEMGVLMLADGVEAASRTLREPSALKIRTLVRQLIDACLKEGQLDECDLTLGDLGKVAESFERFLSHIFHRRIDYPGFNFNQAKNKSETGVPNPDKKKQAG